MSDLFQGQTMTEAYQFISAGTAHTFSFSFQPDKVVFNNITQWVASAGGFPISVWLRDQTGVGDAFQHRVIDSAAGASFNFLTEPTNGFTVADTAGGQTTSHRLISGVTQADPCVVTTTVAHGWQTNQIVRFTDLGQVTAVLNRGMGQLNDLRFRIVVLTTTTFSLKDPVTGEPIDSTAFTAWVSGGRVNLETHVLSLNNPQVSPYDVTPYVPNPFKYDPVTFRLTAGTAVMGANSDIFLIEVYKWGQLIDLGDLLV